MQPDIQVSTSTLPVVCIPADDEYASLPTGLQQDFAEEYAQLEKFRKGEHKGNLDAFETIVLGNENQ